MKVAAVVYFYIYLRKLHDMGSISFHVANYDEKKIS